MAQDRVIFHVDMDAFFASVEQLDDSNLRGKPVLVGYDGRRGVVAAASYEARRFGCRSAQPMAIAKRACPHAVIVPVRSRRYTEVSRKIFSIFDDFSPLVEPLSIDEAFIDMTGTDRLFGQPIDAAKMLKSRIFDEVRLTASVGLAPNKFLAKLASDMNKPDGLTVVHPHDLDGWFLDLEVSRIWGIGPRAAERLSRGGVCTVADIRKMNDARLKHFFGNEAQRYYRLSRGMDDRLVTPDHQAKSISNERTFSDDVESVEEVQRVLLEQVENIGRRLRRKNMLARGVSLKIRFGDFQTISRSQALDQPTNLTAEIWHVARNIFDLWAARSFQPVRLIGAAVERLGQANEQMDLFIDSENRKLAQAELAADQIVARFGRDAVKRAGTMRQKPGD